MSISNPHTDYDAHGNPTKTTTLYPDRVEVEFHMRPRSELDEPAPASLHSCCHENQKEGSISLPSATRTIHGPHAEGDRPLLVEALRDRLDSARAEVRLWFWLAIAQSLLSLYLLARG